METTSHYFLHCLLFHAERSTFLNNINEMDSTIFNKSDSVVTRIQLFGNEEIRTIKMVDVTITEVRLKTLMKEIFKEEFEKQQKKLLNLISGSFDITMEEMKKVQSDINELKASLEHTETVLEEKVAKAEKKVEKLQEQTNELWDYQVDPERLEFRTKNLGLLYKTRPFLERNALLALYYSYIQTYMNYANIAWGSTCRTNLKKTNSQQKHAISIIFNKNKCGHRREISKEQKVLDIYQLSILSNIIFMHRVENKIASSIFLSKFCKLSNSYPTNFSAHNFFVPTLKLKKVGI